jgi:hypothetical protein
MIFHIYLIWRLNEDFRFETLYEETEHFIINKQFANNYKGMLKELLI